MLAVNVVLQADGFRNLMAKAMLAAALTCCFVTSQVAGASSMLERDDPHPAAAIELNEGLAISSVQERRAAIQLDPIAAEVVAGTWVMPRSGDSVKPAVGQSKKWEPIKAGADGWFSGGALNGGYLAASFTAPEAAVMMLEAAGHGMVYASGEPRAGDPYSTGYVQLPVRVRKGSNTLLFQVGRGRLKARLTKPRAAAFLSTADVTLPDLALGERAEYEASVLAVNASESSTNHLTIVARSPDGQETRTVVPALAPLSVRKVAFAFRVDVPPGSETVPIELKLKQRTGHDEHSEGEALDAVKITVRARKPGQTYARTFHSAIDGSLQYYAVVPALPGPSQGAPRARSDPSWRGRRRDRAGTMLFTEARLVRSRTHQPPPLRL